MLKQVKSGTEGQEHLSRYHQQSQETLTAHFKIETYKLTHETDNSSNDVHIQIWICSISTVKTLTLDFKMSSCKDFKLLLLSASHNYFFFCYKKSSSILVRNKHHTHRSGMYYTLPIGDLVKPGLGKVRDKLWNIQKGGGGWGSVAFQ